MSEINLENIQAVLRSQQGFEVSPKGGELKGPEGGKEFGEFFKDALKQVNELQLEADQAMNGIATGESEDIHNTMIAIQKADVSFKMMMEVRKKLLEAYQQVMRMQV